MRSFIVAGAWVAAMACVGGCGSAGNGKPPALAPAASANSKARPRPVATIAAYTIWDQYGTDAAKATTDYTGKAVAITGRVQLIRKDPNGTFLLGLAVADGRTLFANAKPDTRGSHCATSGLPANVGCRIRPDAIPEFPDAKQNEDITIIGVPYRTQRADVWRDYILIVNDCYRKK